MTPSCSTSDECEIEVIHTPGHASNHVCYLHRESNWLFTGDHVIDGSTVVIDPPDGNMKQYIESLRRVKRLECEAIAPGHGDVIEDPDRVVDLDHRSSARTRRQGCPGINGQPRSQYQRAGAHMFIGMSGEKLFGLAERFIAGASPEARGGRQGKRSGRSLAHGGRKAATNAVLPSSSLKELNQRLDVLQSGIVRTNGKRQLPVRAGLR